MKLLEGDKYVLNTVIARFVKREIYKLAIPYKMGIFILSKGIFIRDPFIKGIFPFSAFLW